MRVGTARRDAATRGTHQKTLLYQERLDHILDSVALLAHAAAGCRRRRAPSNFSITSTAACDPACRIPRSTSSMSRAATALAADHAGGLDLGKIRTRRSSRLRCAACADRPRSGPPSACRRSFSIEALRTRSWSIPRWSRSRVAARCRIGRARARSAGPLACRSDSVNGGKSSLIERAPGPSRSSGRAANLHRRYSTSSTTGLKREFRPRTARRAAPDW